MREKSKVGDLIYLMCRDCQVKVYRFDSMVNRIVLYAGTVEELSNNKDICVLYARGLVAYGRDEFGILVD